MMQEDIQLLFNELETKFKRQCNQLLEAMQKLELNHFQNNSLEMQVDLILHEFGTDLSAARGRITSHMKIQSKVNESHVNSDNLSISELSVGDNVREEELIRQIRDLEMTLNLERRQSEKKLMGLIDSVNDRMVKIERSIKANIQEEEIGEDSIARRLARLENSLDRIDSQTEIARSVSTAVQTSIQEIAHHMDDQFAKIGNSSEVSRQYMENIRSVIDETVAKLKHEASVNANNTKTKQEKPIERGTITGLLRQLEALVARVDLLEARVQEEQQQSIFILETLIGH